MAWNLHLLNYKSHILSVPDCGHIHTTEHSPLSMNPEFDSGFIDITTLALRKDKR